MLLFAQTFKLSVGVDAHIAPLGTIEFARDFRKDGLNRQGDVDIAPYAKKEKSMYAIAPYAYTHRCRAYGAIRLPSLSKVFLSARSVGRIA